MNNYESVYLSESVYFSEFVGKTPVSIVIGDTSKITFKFSDETTYEMYHEQDCCESVYIEEIHGDLDDLIGSEILVAEESRNSDYTDESSYTWTFYKIRTRNSDVTIRWYGTSNGYYSEAVSVFKLVPVETVYVFNNMKFSSFDDMADEFYFSKGYYPIRNNPSVNLGNTLIYK